MKRAIVAMSLLFCARGSSAADPWSGVDYALGGVAAAATIVDYGQTRYIAKHPEKFYEITSKQFIGEHPSVGKVNNYFAASALFYGAAANLLPSPYRGALLGGAIIMRLDPIRKNYSINVKMEFR